MSPRSNFDQPILGFGLAGANSPLGPSPMVYQRNAHLITSMLPESGKTETIAKPNLIRRHCSAVIVDFQDAQITRSTALWRQHVLGQDVSVLDSMKIVPAEFMPTRVDGSLAYADFDPLKMIAQSSSPSIAGTSLMGDFAPVPTSGDPHWAEGARNTLTAVSLYMATDPSVPDELRTMEVVWEILTTASLFKATIRAMRQSEHAFVRDIANSYVGLSKDDREMKSIRNNLRTQVGAILGDKNVIRTMHGNTVNYGELNRRPMTVYVVIPGIYSVALMRYVRMFISVVLSEMERAGIRKFDSPRPPTLFLMDEYNTFEEFIRFVDAMARGRNFGLQAHLLVQSLGQMADTYKGRYRSLMSNMGVVQYAGGTSDEFTANEISRLGGDKWIVAPSASYSHGGREGHSESYSYIKHRELTPDQVMRMPLPYQVVSYTGVGMAEGTLFRYGMKDFPDYLYFMDLLKKGVAPAEAGQRTRMYQALVNKNFDERVAKMYADQAKAATLPVRQRKPPVSIGRILNNGLAHLFGDDTDF